MSHSTNIIGILKDRGGFDDWWHHIEQEDKDDILQEMETYLSGAEGCAEKRLEKAESKLQAAEAEARGLREALTYCTSWIDKAMSDEVSAKTWSSVLETAAALAAVTSEPEPAPDDTRRFVENPDKITDTKRLDWLEASKVCTGGTVWLRAKTLDSKVCETLRAAIDAAMAEAGKEGA